MEIISGVMCLSSIGMFWVGWRNYELYKQAQKKAEQQQKDFEDLLEAIVISTLISGPSSYGALPTAIKAFESNYLGNRKIFKDHESVYNKHGLKTI